MYINYQLWYYPMLQFVPLKSNMLYSFNVRCLIFYMFNCCIYLGARSRTPIILHSAQ